MGGAYLHLYYFGGSLRERSHGTNIVYLWYVSALGAYLFHPMKTPALFGPMPPGLPLDTLGVRMLKALTATVLRLLIDIAFYRALGMEKVQRGRPSIQRDSSDA